MASKKRFCFCSVGPFREPCSPPQVVLRDRVELGQVEGYRPRPFLIDFHWRHFHLRLQLKQEVVYASDGSGKFPTKRIQQVLNSGILIPNHLFLLRDLLL